MAYSTVENHFSSRPQTKVTIHDTFEAAVIRFVDGGVLPPD
jgi:hypothetical protein